MTAAHYFGYLLVAISAVLVARHVQQWRDWSKSRKAGDRREFVRRQLQRRFVASALIGVVGAAITLVDRIPPRPLATTAYLLALLLGGGVILSIALVDIRATRRQHLEDQLDTLAEELHKTAAKSRTSER
jgi:hypothetical protein